MASQRLATRDRPAVSALLGFFLVFVSFVCFVVSSSSSAEVPLPEAKPEKVGVSAERLARIDGALGEAIDHGDCPGAVILVVHDGHVVWRKAYGLRARQPAEVAMTVDTVFDLASLTKPVATAASVMVLVEQGKLRL